MTQTTTDVDLLELTLLEDEFEPPCEHFLHGEQPEIHGGPAEFNVLMPCGFNLKTCGGYVLWLAMGGRVNCSRHKQEQHDKSTIVWLPL